MIVAFSRCPPREYSRRGKTFTRFSTRHFYDTLRAMNHDSLIDAFVAHINSTPREPLSEDTLPFTKSVHVGDAPDGAFGFGYWDWNIKRRDDIDWIDKLNTRLPRRFPPSFYSLVSRYIFPRFDFGGLHFFANTPEAIEENGELRTAIFCDKYLSPMVLSSSRGLIPVVTTPFVSIPITAHQKRNVPSFASTTKAF